MEYIIFKNQTTSLNEFIDFWKQLYVDTNDKLLYSPTIAKHEFDGTDIQKLYEWKNQSILSSKKQKSLDEKIKGKLNLINQLKTQENIDLDVFNEDFSNLKTAVWRIFLLHIIKPEKFPIYDQHIHRAYNFIHGLPYQDIDDKIKDKLKLDFYFKKYLPFINDECKGISLKKIDEAMYCFGQFLKQKKYNYFFKK